MLVKSTLSFASEILFSKGSGALYYYRRLKDLREDSDKTQKEIAAILGIDQRVYSTYETGKREIPVHLLIELANYYKISIDYLLGRTNNPNIKN